MAQSVPKRGENVAVAIPQPHGGAIRPFLPGNTARLGKPLSEEAKERRRARRQLVNVVLTRVAPLLTKKKLEEMDGTELADIAHKLMDAGTPKPKKQAAIGVQTGGDAFVTTVVQFDR